MIGFSIMMWFVSFVILMVAVALLRGNVSTMHGKVFDTTEDKVGYGKQLVLKPPTFALLLTVLPVHK